MQGFIKLNDLDVMQVFPTLTTDRLTLRQTRIDDIASLLKYCNNKNISDQIFNIPYPYLEADAIFRLNFVFQGFKNRERYVFAITLTENQTLIGEMGLHLDQDNDNAQLGAWIAEPFWNQGIATEAMAAILRFGFETLDLNKIYATHLPENGASGNVMLKNHMIKEAELKEHYKMNKVYRSVIQYRLTKAEYQLGK
ncbi:MAG: hypothetical protein RL329_2402 [Bacteroidota bacterium]